MFQIVGAMAEFERALIQERVRAGLRNARAKNNVGGVKHFSSTLTRCTPKSAISLSLRFANPTFFGAPFSHNLQVAGFFAKQAAIEAGSDLAEIDGGVPGRAGAPS
jgi:hypothetical protein